MRKYRWSLIAAIACSLLMSYASLVFYPKWNKDGGEAAISYDASGYYWYLPSIFIYKDLKHQSFKDSILKKYQPTPPWDFQQGFKLPNGNYCMKYSSGMAVMFSPFFAIANTVAKPLGYPKDGFSPPYELAIQLGGLLFALIGIWYFRKLLLRFYKDSTVAICLLLLVIGTNYLDYAAINIGMSHSWLFTLYVLLLLNTDNFYRSFKYKYAIRIGLLIGLVTLIRPTEIISCLIPLFWGMQHISITAIREKFLVLKQHIVKLIIAAVCAALIIAIQPLYWKYVSGHWLVYSYQNQGFSWLHPHILDYTFSYGTGWLRYAPVMLFAFIGILPFIKTGKNKVAILTFFLLNYYIVCAWDVWTFGGRAMLQSYPILFFPLASFIELMQRKKLIRIIAIPFLLLFSYVGLWSVYFSHRPGPLSWDDFNDRTYFWHTIGRWGVPSGDLLKTRDNTDYFTGTPQHMKLLYENNFEQDSIYCPQSPIDGNKSLFLNDSIQNSPVYFIPYHKGQATWIRAQASFRTPSKEWTPWKMTQFVVKFYYKGKDINGRIIRVQRFMDNNKTANIYIDEKIPTSKKFDNIGVFFINSYTDQPILIDNLKVWSFD